MAERDVPRNALWSEPGFGHLVDAAVQIFGGMGYMRESTIERMARDARVQAIGGGATEVMLEEVAKRLKR